MRKIIPPSKEELYDLLFNKLWSQRKVAEHYLVSRSTVISWLRAHGLLNKTNIETVIKKKDLTNKEKSYNGLKIIPPSKEELYDLLFNKLWSKKRIAKYYEVSRPTITSWMKEYQLLNKTSLQIMVKKRNLTNKEKGFNPRKIIPPSKEELYDLLFNKLWSQRKVAEHYGVCKPTLAKWVKEYNLLYKTTTDMIVKKIAKTKSKKPKVFKFKELLERARSGEIIKIPGFFDSDFLEEYNLEELGEVKDEDFGEDWNCNKKEIALKSSEIKKYIKKPKRVKK